MNIVKNYSSIPVFDLNDIESSGGLDKEQKIKSFVEGMRDHGFISIKVDGLNDLISRAYSNAQSYFNMAVETKHLDKPNTEKSAFGGYLGRFTENLSQVGEDADNHQLVEFKETFLFNGLLKNHPLGMDDTSTIEEFHHKMSAISNKILDIFKNYFGIEDSEKCEFDPHSALSYTRLTWYPPMEEIKNHSNVIWCGSHYDINPFALLPKATTSGLQMKKGDDDHWIDIDVPDDTIILNTGRYFEALTAGIIKPTYHRVIANPESALTGRISIIHFPCWNHEYTLQPWSNCLKEATKDMENEVEKQTFSSSLLKGSIQKLQRIYFALGNNIKISNDEIKELAREFPNNEAFQVKWPWAFESK